MSRLDCMMLIRDLLETLDKIICVWLVHYLYVKRFFKDLKDIEKTKYSFNILNFTITLCLHMIAL